MCRFKKRFRLIFGRCYYGGEYWVRLDDIEYDADYQEQNVNRNCLKHEVNYWHNTGVYKTRILIDRDFRLIDGYITCLVAKEVGEKTVPVIFLERWRTHESNNRANADDDA